MKENKMKKIAMALFLMLFPFAAQAQTEVSDEILQKAADELKPAFCANDLKQAVQIVEECYAKVDQDSTHQNMNQCLTEDIFVMSIFTVKEKQYFDRGQTNPYADLAFTKMFNYVSRIKKYPSFMTKLKGIGEMKQIGETVGGKIGKNLKQENCLNFDKLK